MAVCMALAIPFHNPYYNQPAEFLEIAWTYSVYLEVRNTTVEGKNTSSLCLVNYL